ncbi:MAG: methionine synthase [Dehalococcoidia bacterium]|nr:methionine synthase [Dehalococcoidia bacterium]
MATAVGSMPYTDPKQAMELVLKYLPSLPIWPQLPKRSFLESMYVQFTEGLPGINIENDRVFVDLNQDIDTPLRTLLQDYEAKAYNSYAIKKEYAPGLYAFLSARLGSPRAVKGHITGPVSCGLGITDADKRPILYHEILADALARLLRLRATWQEKQLRMVCPNTMIWVDEPYMSSFGSAFISISREQVLSLLGEVLAGIEGTKGVHCCGNTDWSVLLATSVNILSFDAYNYAQTLSLYPAEVKAFINRGGIIAWGIVPNDEDNLSKETVSSLRDRLEEAMAAFTRKGISIKQLTNQALITPSCGLGAISPDGAIQALELTAGLSAELRKKYA